MQDGGLFRKLQNGDRPIDWEHDPGEFFIAFEGEGEVRGDSDDGAHVQFREKTFAVEIDGHRWGAGGEGAGGTKAALWRAMAFGEAGDREGLAGDEFDDVFAIKVDPEVAQWWQIGGGRPEFFIVGPDGGGEADEDEDEGSGNPRNPFGGGFGTFAGVPPERLLEPEESIEIRWR